MNAWLPKCVTYGTTILRYPHFKEANGALIGIVLLNRHTEYLLDLMG